MTEWSEASLELVHYAERIIGDFYPYLKPARIGFVFRDEAQKVAGQAKLGGVSKVSDRDKVYIDLDFLIWVSEKDWTDLDTNTREALLDHLLCHCGGSFEDWRIRKPEISEFAEVIARRGLWNKTLMKIDKALTQLVDHQGQLILDGFDRLTKRPGAVVSVDPSVMQKVEGAQ